jgi:hypothetical protein
MKKERLTKLVGGIGLSLATILPLAGETYAAGRIRSSVKNKPAKQSRKTIDLSALTPETPFAEAIDILRNSTKPPLNIIVFWRDLEENSDVDRNTPIGLEAVSGVSLGKNLELMLMSVSADPKSLGYVVENGVIIIATKDSLPTKRRARIYDVTDLVGRPANYFSPLMGFGGMMPGMGYGGMMPYGGMRPYGGMGYGSFYGGADYTGRYGGGYGGGRPYGYSRGGNVADLIDTLYGPSRRTRRNR